MTEKPIDELLSEEITTIEKRKGIPFALAFSAANNNYAILTFFSSIFVLFLSELGFSNTRIGFLLGLIHVTGIFTPFFTPTVEKIGPKRAFLVGNTIRVTLSTGLLLIPWILNHFGSNVLWIAITVMMGIFALFRTFTLAGWNPWSQEYVPANIRGKYTAMNNIINSVVGFLVLTIAGYILNKNTEMRTFMLIFGVAIFFGIVTIITATFVPGGQPIISKTEHKRAFTGLNIPLKDRNYLMFILGVSLMTLATSPMESFISLYMLDNVGLTTGQVVYLTSATTLGAVLSSYIWGWAADRYGSKPVLQSGVFLYILLPIFYFFLPHHSGYSLLLALLVSFYAGIASMGWVIGQGRQLNVNMIPMKSRTSYLAIWSALGGITWGISKVMGGRLIDLTENVSGSLLGRPIDSYFILFVISFALPIFAFLVMQFVRIDEGVSVGEFVSMFIHGRPFMAFNSLIRFHRAKDESTAINITEQLGNSKSPLTVDELLLALADPRFYVRFEAIISIAHHGEDPRLTKALANVLERGEPALSVVAAWALSKAESKEAKNALRKSMYGSNYRSVRAHAARSLSMVDDIGSKDYFLEQMNKDSDVGMRIAYASALGKLKVKESVPQTIELLKDIQDGYLRNEVGLALARSVGDDQEYIRMLREIKIDMETTLAAAIGDRKKTIRKLLSTLHVDEVLDSCEKYMAKGEYNKGLQIWATLLEKINQLEIPDYLHLMIDAILENLEKQGLARPEFFILSMTVIDTLDRERKNPGIEI